ncbi:TPA: hypothetical protein DDZ86_00805 [Candidatus Dependentiae bacterium]|nr:MAG: General secretion pathway protein D [candidate division TM6 bacterium GW2011_GWF2_43_87]HBL98164.1 hypothetical protein [Candidatus Dependentiae bacterium]
MKKERIIKPFALVVCGLVVCSINADDQISAAQKAAAPTPKVAAKPIVAPAESKTPAQPAKKSAASATPAESKESVVPSSPFKSVAVDLPSVPVVPKPPAIPAELPAPIVPKFVDEAAVVEVEEAGEVSPILSPNAARLVGRHESKEASAPSPIPAELTPWENGDKDELIEFNFEDAELSTVISYMEERFGLSFILDSVLTPLPQMGKTVAGVKLSFKTNKPLPKKEAWFLFLTFLDMAGMAVVPGPTEKVWRIASTDGKSPLSALKERVPTLIGVNPAFIPDDSALIRYVYFARNTSLDMVKNLLDAMKSQISPQLIIFTDIRAIVITDKAANIKAMLEVIAELDKASEPETISIVRLQHTDATSIADFYKNLVKDDEQGSQGLASRLAGGRRQTLSYFPVGIRVIPEPRTNTLILLGTSEGVAKVEEFIVSNLDKQTTLTHKFTKVIPLKHIQADAAAEIIRKVAAFKASTPAAGGVRDGDKYFKPLSVEAEKTGNRLIITGDYEDYLKINEIITKIDVEQDQVALQIFIVNIDLTDLREIGTQLRNKIPGISGLIGNNTSFQTSGLGFNQPVIENTAGTGAYRLLGDLVNLATNAAVGATYMTMGSDSYGIWGMLRLLEEHSNSNIVQSPFVLTTNNYPAKISDGSIRRVTSATTVSAAPTQTSYIDMNADLKLEITPRISYEGYVTLDIYVSDCQFTEASDPTSGNRITKEIRTSLILADKETVILGGILRNKTENNEILGSPFSRIPIIGWLLGKNRKRNKEQSSIFVFITPEVIPAHSSDAARKFTEEKFNDITKTLEVSREPYQLKDPINKWYFRDGYDQADGVDSFMEKEAAYIYPSQKQLREPTRPANSLSTYL